MQTASEADAAQECARGVLVPLHPNVRRHSTLARPPEHLLPSTQAGHPKPAAHPWPTAQADTHNPPLQPPRRLVSARQGLWYLPAARIGLPVASFTVCRVSRFT